MLRSLSPLLFVAGMAAAIDARADGVIEINQDCAAVGCFAGDGPGFPVTISALGQYRLSGDMSVDSDVTVISAETNGDIHVDLGGFTIRGPVTCDGTPATCSANATSSCLVSFRVRGGTLRNGTLRGGNGRGVCGGYGWGFLLADLLVTENAADGISSGLGGPTWPNELVIENVRSVRNGGDGASLAWGGDRHHRIADSFFVGNGGAGLRTAGDLSVFDNQFFGNGSHGIAAHYGSAQLAAGRNTFMGNNGGNANAQFSGTLRDMGGNACAKATCP